MTNFTANEVENILPYEGRRKIYLSLFLEALKKANSYGNNKWGAYCDKKQKVIRLVVGRHIAFTIHNDGDKRKRRHKDPCIWLALDKFMLKEEKEKNKLENLVKLGIWLPDKIDYPEYDLTPSINGWYNPCIGDLDSWHIIRDFHFKFIERATKKCEYFNPASQNKNSQEFLQYLENELRQSVPIPGYANNGIKKTHEKVNSQISEREFNKNYERDLKRVSNLSPEKMLNRMKGLQKKSEPVEVVSLRRPRNAIVAAYALTRANGVCQLCGNSAPFVKKDGTPFLEVHHIQWLSEEGLDDSGNTVALCPNCHRKMHILNLENDKIFLLNLVTRSS